MTSESIKLSKDIEALQRRRDEVAAMYSKERKAATAMRLRLLDEMIGNSTYALGLMARSESSKHRYERFRPGGKIHARV